MVIYKTTNLVNEKFYVGKDIKNNPNYLGSGLILKNAINKYGIENFKKEILELRKEKKTIKEIANLVSIGVHKTRKILKENKISTKRIK